MSEIPAEQYLLRVEQHFGQRRGGPLVLSPSDWRLVESWQAEGIPLRIVMRGINRAFDRFAASGPRPDRINSLRYCEQEVQAAWQEERVAKRRTDETGTAPSGLPGAADHIGAAATACRRAAKSSRGEAAACLTAAAADLDGLAAAAADDDADPVDIDRRCADIEARTRAQLTALDPAPDIDALLLPRFSPYDVS